MSEGRAVVVLGDSVPFGHATDAPAWPARLSEVVTGLPAGAVHRYGGMGTALAALPDRADVLGEHARADTTLAVLVHAGHNDTQLSGDGPRVPEPEFRAAAAALDETLAAHGAVARHAFVGLVPLLPLDEPGSVPFSGDQPGRSLAYDAALAETVSTHLPLERDTERWRAWTADGVHPNGDGHAHVAERVAAWLDG